MHIRAVRTKLIRPGDDLIAAIQGRVRKMREGSVLAVTSKAVSLWEGRFMPKRKGVTLEKLVREEADAFDGLHRTDRFDRTDRLVWKSKYCWLALTQGMLIPNAGVDESNAFGGFILWPKDSFASAQRMHNALARHYKVKNFGVLITDSWPMPLRRGVAGIALGYYGFKGLKNYIGKKDLMGRRLRMSTVSVADCLASAAVLAMGEGSERTPMALIEDAPVQFTRKRVNKKELHIPAGEDVYKNVLRLKI